MDARDSELTRELHATVQTRKELGKEYEEELIASFLEKFDQRLETVVEKQMRRQLAQQQMVAARDSSRPRSTGDFPGFSEAAASRILAGASLVLAIPLSAIAAVNTGLPGLLVCWAGVVGVNAVQAKVSWFGFGRTRQERGGENDWD
jgi:hypothetical protein